MAKDKLTQESIFLMKWFNEDFQYMDLKRFVNFQ